MIVYQGLDNSMVVMDMGYESGEGWRGMVHSSGWFSDRLQTYFGAPCLSCFNEECGRMMFLHGFHENPYRSTTDWAV